MKVVILAGGLGTRLAEETEIKPKPMVEIGEHPILWHILKHYSYYGFNEFYVALGYKGEYIKRYFLDYVALQGSMTVQVGNGDVTRHQFKTDPWTLHLIDTGTTTMTGGRVLRLKRYLDNEPFLLTYGDGVSDVDIRALVAFHKAHGKTATLTAVRPPARFGRLDFDGDLVSDFTEKPQMGEGFINGGFMVLNPAIFNYLQDDSSILEHALEQLSRERQLAAYKHTDFWQCMDTLRDKRYLDQLWSAGQAPWKH
ncbi:MAG: glucose-1-phosphate cytidylyltransferase [Capsulimonadaceae bacterium]|nr:glucose-1-phosphate cytidylyltransferase [Capsulimonadaceae bacterium]